MNMTCNRHQIREFFGRRLYVLAWAALGFTCIGQIFGRSVWFFELFTHFLPHAGLTILLASVIFPCNRNPFIKAGFFLIGSTLMVWSLLPLHVYRFSASAATDNNTHAQSVTRIAFQNVHAHNPNPTHTLDKLIAHQPDIVLLIEAGGSHWDAALAAHKEAYPVHCGTGRADVFSIQALIAHRSTRCELLTISGFFALKITLENGDLMYAIHAPPPISTDLAREQRAFLQALKPLAMQEKRLLLVGDMNLSAFSPLYRDFIDTTSLQRMTSHGLPTWLPFGLSIDHVLTNDLSQPTQIKALGWNGSDHRGFMVHW